MFRPLFILIVFGLIFAESTAAFSDNSLSPSINQPNANSSIGTAGGSTQSKSLQGGIEKVELGLEKLRDVELDLKTALRATTMLFEEVTRQPVRVITQPEVIGTSGTVINVPIGTEPTGPPQPARRARLNLAMKNMTPIIAMLKKNVDEFVSGEKQLDLPPDIMTKLQPQFQKWVKTVNMIAIKQRQLEQITYAPPYDNLTIAALSSIIIDDLKDLEKTRLEIYKVIRKEGKHRSFTY